VPDLKPCRNSSTEESAEGACPVPAGHWHQRGKCSPSQVGTGTCPKQALDPVPGERAGEFAAHHGSTAAEPGLAGSVRGKLHDLMYSHVNGLTL